MGGENTKRPEDSNPVDTGVEQDAGADDTGSMPSDTSTSDLDSGSDGAETTDSGRASETGTADSGASDASGSGEEGSDSGCQCSTGGGAAPGAWFVVFVIALLGRFGRRIIPR